MINNNVTEILKEMHDITDEQIEQHLLIISKSKNKNERLSWKRKYDKLTEILENKMTPIEDKLVALYAERIEVQDEIDELRKIMIKECVHPKDLLVHKSIYVLCKFCNAKLKIPEMNDLVKEDIDE